jgi:hypothetical protein
VGLGNVELVVVGVLVPRTALVGMGQMLLMLLHTADILNLTKDMRLFVLSTTLIRNTHNN